MAPYPPYFDSPVFANMNNPVYDLYIYVTTPETFHGFIMPLVLSVALAYNYRRYLSATLIFALFMSMVLAWNTSYMGHTGLHTFPVEYFVLGLLIWKNEPFTVALAYPFSFFTALSSDVINGLLHPANAFWYTWYYGIGGAGFHDGLFIDPLYGIIAVIIVYMAKWLNTELVKQDFKWNTALFGKI